MSTTLRNRQKSADAESLRPSANRQQQDDGSQRTSTFSPTERLIRLDEVKRLVGLGKSKIYEMVAADRFPKPYKISSAARWSQHEVFAWIENIKGRADRP